MPAFVDTNIWVYALTTKEPTRHQQAKALLCSLPCPCINGQLLRELGRVLLQKSGIDEAAFRQIILVLAQTCHIVPDTTAAMILASELRVKYGFSYWDSLIVAAALEGGCETLYTEDMQHRQVIEGRLTLVNPFAGA